MLEKYDGALTALGYTIGYACSQDSKFRSEPLVQDTIDVIIQFIVTSSGTLCAAACKVRMRLFEKLRLVFQITILAP